VHLKLPSFSPSSGITAHHLFLITITITITIARCTLGHIVGDTERGEAKGIKNNGYYLKNNIYLPDRTPEHTQSSETKQ